MPGQLYSCRGGGSSCQLGEQIASTMRRQETFVLLIFIRVGFNSVLREWRICRTRFPMVENTDKEGHITIENTAEEGHMFIIHVQK